MRGVRLPREDQRSVARGLLLASFPTTAPASGGAGIELWGSFGLKFGTLALRANIRLTLLTSTKVVRNEADISTLSCAPYFSRRASARHRSRQHRYYQFEKALGLLVGNAD